MHQATPADIQRLIQTHGIAVLHDCGGPHGPIRTFTCGFTDHGLPELICIGLPSQHVIGPMNMTYHDMVIAKTRKPGPFETDDWFSMTMKVVNADRAEAAKYAHGTEDFYGRLGKVPQYMQMAWCDVQGIYPWEEGFAEKYRTQQPNLRSKIYLAVSNKSIIGAA